MAFTVLALDEDNGVIIYIAITNQLTILMHGKKQWLKEKTP